MLKPELFENKMDTEEARIWLEALEATLPLALRRQRERLRRNWNKQDAAKREEQCTIQR